MKHTGFCCLPLKFLVPDAPRRTLKNNLLQFIILPKHDNFYLKTLCTKLVHRLGLAMLSKFPVLKAMSFINK